MFARRRSVPALLLVAVLGLPACSGAPRKAVEGEAAARAIADSAATPAPEAAAGTPAKSAARLSVTPVTAGGIHDLVRRSRSPVVLVNVWATWCGPCRQEFPDLLRVYQEYRERGVELVLVSADFDDQVPEVEKFLGAHQIAFPTYIKTGDDMQFIDAMSPKWTGAIPATFVYEGGGALRHFHEGMASYQEFQGYVQDVLRSKATTRSQEEHS